MRQSNDTEAIIVSDLHLSHKPPISRSTEASWYEVMQRHCNQLMQLSMHLNGPIAHNIPVLCPGDIFHVHNPCPELINFALENLPHLYAVPGNHDLPNHRLSDIRKSGYWTLVRAGRVTHLEAGTPKIVGNLCLWGFPFSTRVMPNKDRSNSLMRDIALVHQYVWTEKTGYPGAPESHRLKAFRKRVRNYDYVFVGDNHIPFISSKQTPVIVNCGSFMRRNIDQVDYKPRVWLLKRDGSVVPKYLDCSKDKFLDARKLKKVRVANQSMTEFLAKMKDLQDVAIDFEEAVVRYLRKHKVEAEVEKIILSAIEDGKNGK